MGLQTNAATVVQTYTTRPFKRTRGVDRACTTYGCVCGTGTAVASTYEHDREVKSKVEGERANTKGQRRRRGLGSSLILLSGGGLGTYFRAGARSARCDLAILDLTITIHDHRL
jgi:hypothetical protein